MSEPSQRVGVPTVSVVMAVHNAEPFLRDAIESILLQTFADFELVVVDDGSTDQTRDMLATYTDPRVRVVTLTRHGGIVGAVNAGLREARGELIARMDGDDVSEPERLAAQVSFMRAHPAVVLVGSSFVYVDAGGRSVRTEALPTANCVLQPRLLTCNQFLQPSVMMRASSVRAVGGYRDLAGDVASDYDLWLRLAEVGEIANLPAALVRYRVHEKQVSMTKLVNQRLAANMYRALAVQRRAGQIEDVPTARSSRLLRGVEMGRALSADYLRWAALYSDMGRTALARALVFKAICAAPADRRAWTALLWTYVRRTRTTVLRGAVASSANRLRRAFRQRPGR